MKKEKTSKNKVLNVSAQKNSSANFVYPETVVSDSNSFTNDASTDEIIAVGEESSTPNTESVGSDGEGFTTHNDACDGNESPVVSTETLDENSEVIPLVDDLEVSAENDSANLEDEDSDAAKPAPKPPKVLSKKKQWIKRIFLLVVFGFTFYAMYLLTASLGGGEVASLGKIMHETDMRFFVSAVLLGCFLFFSDAFKYSILSRMTVNKFHYGYCFTTAVIGKFYDNITPFATGGQPFQMFHMRRKGYPDGIATAIPSLKYIIQLYVFIFVSIILYIINPGALDYLDPNARGFIQMACYIGLVFAVSAPSIFAFFALMPKTASKVLSFFLRILHKIKIIKNYDVAQAKVLKFVSNYQTAFKQIAKKRSGLIILIIVSIIDCLLFFSLPYFLLVGMGGTTPSWKLMLDVATLNSYSFFAASLVPTPGNTGAIEASYSMVFAPVAVSAGTLFWIVFIWRFLTYYLYIFVGLFYNMYHYVQRKIQTRKNKF